MITLFTFGPALGLPDPSPFVMKADVLLKMSGLPYRKVPADVRKAPKSKLPYIDDDGTIVADSTLIRWHLEQHHGIDFDKGLTAEQKGIAWAAEKLCEDNLYWAGVYDRWIVDSNFERGPRKFFDRAPAPLRPLVRSLVRRNIRRSLNAQGMGRHASPDIERIACAGLDAISGILGTKPWLVGDRPCGADATVWSFVTGTLCPVFDGTITRHAQGLANLKAYSERGAAHWYPEGLSAAS